MKVIIPMCGRGSRFQKEGIITPKPLIRAKGKYLVEWALSSIPFITSKDMIFIFLEEHEREHNISKVLTSIFGNEIVLISCNGVTEGQAITAMKGIPFVDPEEELIIFNTDTFIESNISDATFHKESDVKGIISVIEKKEGDNWSFAKIDERGLVVEVTEKKRISDWASTGLYYFSKSKDFTWAVNEMIRKNIRVNNEFYIMPCYNELISRGDKVIINRADAMWDLGNPTSLKYFEENHSDSR